MDMTVGELLWDFEAMRVDEPNGAPDGTREATQEDIRQLLG